MPIPLREISDLIPQEWLPAAVGTPKQCAQAWQKQLQLGADGVVIHGSTPTEFQPILAEYKALRDA